MIRDPLKNSGLMTVHAAADVQLLCAPFAARGIYGWRITVTPHQSSLGLWQFWYESTSDGVGVVIATCGGVVVDHRRCVHTAPMHTSVPLYGSFYADMRKERPLSLLICRTGRAVHLQLRCARLCPQ